MRLPCIDSFGLLGLPELLAGGSTMVNIYIKVALGLAGIVTVIYGATNYYNQTIECMNHLRGVFDATVPLVLSISAAWFVMSRALNDRR